MTEYVLVFAIPKCGDFEEAKWWPGHTDFSNHPGRVLVCHKDRPAWQKGRINLPGGKIEPGETPVDAAKRELKEETGLDHLPQFEAELHGLVEGKNSRIHHVRLVVDSGQKIMPREGETEISGSCRTCG